MKVQKFADVWDAIEATPEEAAEMKLRSALLMALQDEVRSWGVTQVVAAGRLGLTQPRLNDLLRGRINNFSISALLDLATRARLAVDVQVRRAA